MKLHYSQTGQAVVTLASMVLLPYEITLLSNVINSDTIAVSVLLPYEITLLSNNDDGSIASDIEFYYLMKLHYSQTSNLK